MATVFVEKQEYVYFLNGGCALVLLLNPMKA